MKNLIYKTQRVTLAEFAGITLALIALIGLIMFIVNAFVLGIHSTVTL